MSTLAKSIRELGRISKTLFLLQYLQDEGYRRRILIYINHGEARHALARQICYGNRGELKHSYRRGQEEQLGALGLVLNLIVYWNTRYLDLALSDLEQTQSTIQFEELDRITPLVFEHIRILGRYDFDLHPFVQDGKLRPLRSRPQK